MQYQSETFTESARNIIWNGLIYNLHLKKKVKSCKSAWLHGLDSDGIVHFEYFIGSSLNQFVIPSLEGAL